MTMTDTENRVRSVLQKALMLDQAQFPLSAKLVEDLGVSSLDRFELVMGLEDEFAIEMPQDAQDAILTVGDMVRYIDLRLAA
jgi:acyl carrier protein